MAFLVPLALIAIPLIEIALFIQVGRLIDLWPTLGLVVLTAIVGGYLIRTQGLGTLARAQATLRAGEPPVREMFDGLCIVVGGILLLTPGFLTDAVGIMLLLPPTRALLRARVVRHIHVHATTAGGGPSGTQRDGRRTGPVIDADYREVDESGEEPDDRDDRRGDPPPPSSSRWGRR